LKTPVFVTLAALMLGAVGCGSATAEDFVGLYRGGGTMNYTTSDGEKFSNRETNWSESLTASVSSEKILFGGFCRLTATVTGDRTFTVDRNVCALGQGNAGGGVTCNGQDEVKSGTGTLSEDGKRLDLTLVGQFVQSECSLGTFNETYQYTATLALIRE
jgi:hypothetical protein